MKLIYCRIENFGRLRNFEYSFSDGVNILCRENGWGKSTFASFLCAMFYGLSGSGLSGSGRSRGIGSGAGDAKSRKNERAKYYPWQGGVFGGTILFETAGRAYELTRVFGKRAAEDSFELRDADTNLPSFDFSEKIGEELFCLDRESFVRTVFTAQQDCDAQATDDVNALIGDLAGRAGDMGCCEEAVKRLTEAANRLSPTRPTGALYRREAQIAELSRRTAQDPELDGRIRNSRTAQTHAREKLAALESDLHRAQEELRQAKSQCAEASKRLEEALKDAPAAPLEDLTARREPDDALPATLQTTRREPDGALPRDRRIARNAPAEDISPESQTDRREPDGALAEERRTARNVSAEDISPESQTDRREPDDALPKRLGAARSSEEEPEKGEKVLSRSRKRLLCIGAALLLSGLAGLFFASYAETAGIPLIFSGAAVLAAAGAVLLAAGAAALISPGAARTYAGPERPEPPDIRKLHRELMGCQRAMEQKREEAEEKRRLLLSCRAQLAALEQEAAEFLEQAAEREEEKRRLEELRERQKADEASYRQLTAAASLLQRAKQSLTARYADPIRQSFAGYWERITGYSAAGIRMDANSLVTLQELGRQRAVRDLSRGYADLAGICLRAALADAMYPEGRREKPPLILDDPFTNLDDEKIGGALRFLDEIGARYQILYMTCSKSRCNRE